MLNAFANPDFTLMGLFMKSGEIIASETTCRFSANVANPISAETIKSVFSAMLDIDRSVFADTGFGLLSHEFRLILHLFSKDNVIVKDATLSAHLSGRAFHEMLKRLEADGVLFMEQNENDRRSKSVRLSPRTAEQILDQFKKQSRP